MRRRAFFKTLIAGALVPLVASLINKFAILDKFRRFLRPPGVKTEKEFLEKCIGCSECANVCPNQCISMLGLDKGLDNLLTPQITARSRACTLCMACTQVCPTGALEKLEPTEEGRLAVNMGTAVLIEDICYSYHGRTCGACYRACPLPGKAMTIALMEKPTIHADLCVGCGLCEQSCIHMPQAIRVIPVLEVAQMRQKAREANDS